MSFTNKTVIITGAGDGLGKALATRLVGLGAIVIGIGRTESKLLELQKKLGEKFFTYTADISDSNELDIVYNNILSVHTKIDILVNNAAIRYEGSMSEHSLDVLQKLLMTNVFGTMGSIYKVYPTMVAHKSGQILNINSTAGIDICKDRAPYAGSKFAITGFTKGLYEEATQHNIKVMQLHPGGMNTNIFETYKEGYGTHDRMMDKEKVVDIIITMISQPDDMIIDTLVVRKLGKI